MEANVSDHSQQLSAGGEGGGNKKVVTEFAPFIGENNVRREVMRDNALPGRLNLYELLAFPHFYRLNR